MEGVASVTSLDPREYDLRRLRREAYDIGGCPNGPDGYGNYPCDPKVLYGSRLAECQVCGRVAAWPNTPNERTVSDPQMCPGCGNHTLGADGLCRRERCGYGKPEEAS